METCNLIYALMREIPENEMALSTETVSKLYDKCKLLVSNNNNKPSGPDTYLSKFPKHEMFKTLLGCDDDYASLMVNHKHLELEKAELINDIDKLSELKRNYPEFCSFYVKRYPWYKWNNFNKVN